MADPSRSICKIFVFISWSVAPESHELRDRIFRNLPQRVEVERVPCLGGVLIMRPRVVVVSPPAVSCRNPRSISYGGVERDVWRLGRLLESVGCEVVPVASSDSDFGPGISTSGLSSEPSWCLEDRMPRAYSEDAPALLDSYARHAGTVVEREQADALVLLGPSPQVLAGGDRRRAASCPPHHRGFVQRP